MENKYISKSKSARKALARTLGVMLWQRRQELGLPLDLVSHKTGVQRYELDRIELGKCDVSVGAWLVLLEYYQRRIDFGMLRQK